MQKNNGEGHNKRPPATILKNKFINNLIQEKFYLVTKNCYVIQHSEHVKSLKVW